MFRSNRFNVRTALQLATIVGAFGVTFGCQQLGLRQTDRELLGLYEDNDWDTPEPTQPTRRPTRSISDRGLAYRSDSQEPLPRVTLSRDRKSTPSSSSVRTRLTGDVAQDIDDETNSKPVVLAYGPRQNIQAAKVTSAATHSSSESPKIIDTGVSEVDFEEAVQSLPPGYRDLFKHQLAAIQTRSKDEDSGELKTQSKGVSLKFSDGEVQSTANATSSQDNSVRQASGTTSPLTPTVPTVITAAAIETTSASSVDVPHTTHAVATHLPAVPASNLPNIEPSLRDLPSKEIATTAPRSWHQLTSMGIETLEKELKDSPSSDESLRVSQEVTLRMLYVAQRRLDDAMRDIEGLSKHEQEYIHHQMMALYEASNPDASPVRSRHWTLVMNSQREATHHLAAASNLEVRSAAFCTDVDGYGMLKKFSRYQFTPDQDVLLYCEIDNVAAEQVKNGFESQLQGSYEIRDSQGHRISEQLLPMEPEVCQNHRRDYFIVYKIYMPQQIAPGNYQLRLTIEDMKARKFGQVQLDFDIKK